MKEKKFSDIIERIEYLRKLLKLNKSRFSSDIGMKPQTYNNFIGAQGSKPNIELIHGIVNQYGVNPMWLLGGTGAIFQEGQKGPNYWNIVEPGMLGIQEGMASGPQGEGSEMMKTFKKEMDEMVPILEKMENKIRQMEQVHLPVLERYVGLIKRYFDLDPLSAVEEFKELLKRMDVRMGKKQDRIDGN